MVLTVVITIIAFIFGIYDKRKSNKKDRNQKEMDLLVKPLYSNINNGDIFKKDEPNSSSKFYKPYITFWDGIKQNKYLAGTDDFRTALNNYLEYKDENRPYIEVRNELCKAIETRYEELSTELK